MRSPTMEREPHVCIVVSLDRKCLGASLAHQPSCPEAIPIKANDYSPKLIASAKITNGILGPGRLSELIHSEPSKPEVDDLHEPCLTMRSDRSGGYDWPAKSVDCLLATILWA